MAKGIPTDARNKLDEARHLLRSIAREIDEFYQGSEENDGETEEVFGPFKGMEKAGDVFLQEWDHVYPSWPNLKCLRDDIRKFLEG
jgi:hypothetical protein